MHPVLTRAERLDRAMSKIGRRGTLNRFHSAVTRAAGSDIDRSAYLVLRRLHMDGAARITDLAFMMGVEPSTASRHVQMLANRGWLTKRQDPSDRRVAMAEATEDGHSLVEAIEHERREILDRTLVDWTDRDLDQFVRLFEQFAEDLAAAVDTPTT